MQGAPIETWVIHTQDNTPVLQVELFKPRGQLTWEAWTGRYTHAADRELAQQVAVARNAPQPPSLTDLDRKLLNEFKEENGAPAGLVAQALGISTTAVTKAAKKLQAEGLLEDTGYAMKRTRDGHWDWIDKPKTEGGMVSKPGASTVWRATLAGHAAIGHEPSSHVDWKS